MKLSAADPVLGLQTVVPFSPARGSTHGKTAPVTLRGAVPLK